MKPDPEEIRRLAEDALAEDGAGDDVTSSYLELADHTIEASIVAGTPGVVAGIDVVATVFRCADPDIRYDAQVADGDSIAVGDVAVRLEGRAGVILAGERVALNFLQRLSGIATQTRRFVDAAAGSGIRILDTRKTTPLIRALEKYAVTVGGGHNHRFNLSDLILVKENHLRTIGGVEALRKRLSKRKPQQRIEVEVDSIEALGMLLGAPVDRIMLDNFTPDEIRTAVSDIGKAGRRDGTFRPVIEVSGGVTLDNIEQYCIEGVDDISVGALTHSATPLDFSLEVLER